jgi:hypothetical protein
VAQNIVLDGADLIALYGTKDVATIIGNLGSKIVIDRAQHAASSTGS